MLLKIAGGTVYDPANSREGVVMDLWIRAGFLAPPPDPETRPDKVLDATGLVVMPGGPGRLRGFGAWLLGAAKGYAVKLVNPAGVESWKQGGTNPFDLDARVGHFVVTPRQIITGLAQAATDLGLPHPVHVHCNNLGLPGNWATTLATMEALEGRRAHLTHVQFHSYGGDPDEQGTFASQVPA